MFKYKYNFTLHRWAVNDNLFFFSSVIILIIY